MKKRIFLLLTVILVLLIPPYFIGLTVEQEVKAQLDRLNSNPAIELKLISYQRHWFQSVANIEMDIQLPDPEPGAPQSLTISATQTMQHGPFLWTADSFAFGLMDATLDFSLPADWQSELSRNVDWKSDTLQVTSRTSFDQSTHLVILLNAFNIEQQGATLNIEPARSEVEFSALGHVTSQIKWQGMNVLDNTINTLRLGPVIVDLDQQLVHGQMFAVDAMYAGSISVKIDQLAIQEDSPTEKLALKNILLTANSNMQETVTDLKIKLSADTLQAMALELKNFNYDFSLENLDTTSLKAINRIVSDAQTQPNQDPVEVSAKLQGLLPQLVARGPLLKINQLAINTAEGDIDSHMQIAIDQSIYDETNPMSMMLAIDATAEGYAPEAFFTGLGMADTIEQLVQQNMLIREQSNVKFNFTFKNGQALLNGTTMPLGGL